MLYTRRRIPFVFYSVRPVARYEERNVMLYTNLFSCFIAYGLWPGFGRGACLG
jgi:hypothetical protein